MSGCRCSCAHDAHRTGACVCTGLGLKRERLTDARRFEAARERGDMHELIISGLGRGDEAETAIGTPAGQGSVCAHRQRP
ncbi:hypothetical protein OC00_08825 [Xanthomonas vasicola]|nr:hypothetical protein NX07_10755 [Xanthomonas vasicola]KGR55924.1 hypothetical protein NX09_10085 [Xanthomonas vasicola]KGT84356.1 hypothetical protein OC00_08825 [Xanthomonas vasicola]